MCVCLGIQIQVKELLGEVMHRVRGETLLYWVLRQPWSVVQVYLIPFSHFGYCHCSDCQGERGIADDDHRGYLSVVSGDPLRDSCLKHLSLFQW